jgi:hypothetical protein
MDMPGKNIDVTLAEQLRHVDLLAHVHAPPAGLHSSP